MDGVFAKARINAIFPVPSSTRSVKDGQDKKTPVSGGVSFLSRARWLMTLANVAPPEKQPTTNPSCKSAFAATCSDRQNPLVKISDRKPSYPFYSVPSIKRWHWPFELRGESICGINDNNFQPHTPQQTLCLLGIRSSHAPAATMKHHHCR